MPIMSGIESTREIRRLESIQPITYKRTFIIALTGLATGNDRQEAFDVGVDAFMVKPVSFRDLEKLLQGHVKREVSVGSNSGKAVGIKNGREGGRRAEEIPRRAGSIVSVETERGKSIEIRVGAGAGLGTRTGSVVGEGL